MKILALELSSAERSAAFVLSRADGTGLLPPVERIEKGGRSGKGFSMIDAVLQEAMCERTSVECLAIGLGPGSYTGIRSAIALAQGWSLVRDVRLLGISSAECIAAQARAEGLSGPVRVVIDAQRNEFYVESYEISAEKILCTEPLRLATLHEVEQFAKRGERIIGPDPANLAGCQPVYPRAAALAALAMGRNDFVAAEKLEPIYLREVNFVKAPPPREIH